MAGRGNRVSTSLGRALPGMQNVGANASSNILPSQELVDLVDEAARENGCVKIEISKDIKLTGKKLFRINVADRSWQDKMNDLSGKVDDKTPCIFVLFRSAADCLLIKYIPDLTPVRMKMLYASSMSSVKEMVYQSGKVQIEEYNPSSADELSAAEYQKQRDVEAPLTEAEITQREMAGMETAGGYSLLARLLPQPVALPGMKTSENAQKMLARMASGQHEEEDAEEDEPETGKADEKKSADEDEDGKTDDEAPADGAKQKKEAESEPPAAEEKKEDAPRKSTSAGKALLRRLSGPRRGSGSGEEKAAAKESKKDKKKSVKAAKAVAAAAPEEDADQYPYTLADLVKMKELGEYDDNMDVSRLETYMTNTAFQGAFSMDKQKFAGLPDWKKKNLKKAVGLF